MPAHPRLYRRGATFYHRAAIPTDIRDSYPKAEETFSLKTKDFREAVRRVRVEAARVDRLFEAHRRNAARPGEVARTELTEAEIRRIGEVYYAHLLEEDEDIRLDGFEDVSFDWYAEEGAAREGDDRRDFARGRIDAFYESEAREVLTWDAIGLRLHPKSPDWRKVAREIQAATIRAHKARGQRNDGEVIETPVIAAKPSPAPTNTPLLSVAISQWIAEKSRTSWEQKTADAHRIWTDRFVVVAGDRPLETYTKADARAFKEVLMSLPSNWSKYPELDGKSIEEAAKLATEIGLKPMAVSNTNKIIGFVAAFWNWAKANYDGVLGNPFDGMKLKKSGKARDERDPFTPDELKAIFDAPLYRGCRSAKAWRTPGDVILRDTGLYWVPLIALFSGARSGEIIQLYTSDIAEQDGILRFELTDDGDDQRLKTSTSHRFIPVHPTLVELGLMDLVKARREAKEPRLFPAMGKGADGYYSSPYSRQFRHFLEALGIKHAKIAFHSFRHCFEDACRDCGIPEEIMNALQGHAQGGMASRYGRGYTLERLAEEIGKLRYRRLDLGHLRSR